MLPLTSSKSPQLRLRSPVAIKAAPHRTWTPIQPADDAGSPSQEFAPPESAKNIEYWQRLRIAVRAASTNTLAGAAQADHAS